MAQKVTTYTLCDMDGETDALPFDFSLDGTAYEIDLCPDDAAAFRDAVGRFAEHARPAIPGRRPAPAPRKRNSRDRQASAAIRRWAAARLAETGDRRYAVSDRGRLPVGILAEYRAASHGSRTGGA